MPKPVARLQPEMKECLITILSNAVSNKMVILILKLLCLFSEVCLFNAYAKSRRQMLHDVNVVAGKGSCYFACEYAGRAQRFFFSSVRRQLHCVCDKALILKFMLISF